MSEPIILNPQGTPWTRKADAEKYLKDKELPADKWEARKHGGGWALMDRTMVADDGQTTERPATAANKKERYFLVRFQAKSSPNDQDMVALTLNGDTLIFRREAPAICPESYLEIADHATHKHYQQLPGQTRKVVSEIKTFPYERIREATEAEYKDKLAEGNAIRDKEFAAQNMTPQS